MKPDEDMHAAVEEVDLDPCDLYTDLGTLIVEGRVPGLTDKGFGEGPHCPSPHGQNRHQCDPSSSECQRYEQILKHMLLLWKNGIPMTVEVLLYPDCCAHNVESVPDASYVLLEQWTLHMLPRRVPHASISPRGLIQAVRSFLYFSQLCAWFSLTGGKSPSNVHYRVCVPGEAFSSKFSSQPDCHIFPVANVGRNAAMKVLMKSHPRCGEIPPVPCHKHSQPNLLMKSKCRSENQQASSEPEYLYDGILPSGMSSRTSSPADSMLGESLLDPPNSLSMYPKRYQSPSRCGSPSIEVPEHLMFGKVSPKHEDPPRRSRPQRKPVVERFLKKKDLGDNLDLSECRTTFNRRTSPVTKEVSEPEILATMTKENHVLGYCCIEDCMKNIHYSSDCTENVLREEIEEVLKRLCEKNTGLKCPHTNVHCLSDCMTNIHCLSDQMKNVPREEIEEVLERLREKNTGLKCCHKNVHYLSDYTKSVHCLSDCVKNIPRGEMERLRDRNTDLKCPPHTNVHCLSDGMKNIHCLSDKTKSLHNNSLSHLMDEMKINTNLIEQNKELKKKDIFCKSNDVCDSKNLFKQALRLNKEYSSRKFDRNAKCISPSSLPEVHNNPRVQHSGCLKDYPVANQLLANRLKLLQSSDCFQGKSDGKVCVSEQMPSAEYTISNAYRHDSDRTVLLSQPYPKTSSVNIKKCGALLVKGDSGDVMNDEREILPGVSPQFTDTFNEDHPPHISFLIPSAEKKALFRRSLDSATSLVFHQRSGLPLTSSPAPVRKSGTCFDFDSTLTSVSAIKRALFEKEPEEDDEGRNDGEIVDLHPHLSVSAPASIVSSSLLGTFEESVLNGRLEPVSTVEGFTAEIGASGSFCPRHITLPVTVFFYTLQDMDKVTSPYMGHINLRDRDYHIPKRGTVQVTLFNPHRTVVKMFVVRYDLSDMPVNCQTFLRQRTLYMPSDAFEKDDDAQKWLRYLIHLRFMSSKSGRIYLHTDIRVIIFRKSDLDAATVHGQRPYELRSFTHGPLNPKFSSHRP